MIEKVNPAHPDKVADRIAGAIVDLAYKLEEGPKVAVEVLIGHGKCHVIVESSVDFNKHKDEIKALITRIAGKIKMDFVCTRQDPRLANNQAEEIRCGDNGIFKGVPLTNEERTISRIARKIYDKYGKDGKYILDGTFDPYNIKKFVICQSNAKTEDLRKQFPKAEINPLGDWTGGTDVDSGATNRKLGSDMADGVTGGGLHGKDLSKADVSVNIYAHLKAQETGKVVKICCAIGDETIDGRPYSEVVEIARGFIQSIGGFEKFAEWGLV